MADDTAIGTFTDNGDDQQLVCTGDVSVTNIYSYIIKYTVVLNSRDWSEVWLPEISRFKNQLGLSLLCQHNIENNRTQIW